MYKTTHLVLTVMACLFSSNLSMSQDQGFPYLNALGRFAGLGYTKGGYHAPANGQLPIVRNNHPACSYESRNLLFPYNPGYQSFRVSNQLQNQPGLPAGVPTPADPLPEKIEPEATTPQEPPPEWLKRYLDEKKTLDPSRQRSLAPQAADALPAPAKASDAPGLNERPSPFRFDGENEKSPSDNLLDERDSSSEDDSDLLLLDADELSSNTPLNPVANQRIFAPINRYRQVSIPRRIR